MGTGFQWRWCWGSILLLEYSGEAVPLPFTTSVSLIVCDRIPGISRNFRQNLTGLNLNPCRHYQRRAPTIPLPATDNKSVKIDETSSMWGSCHGSCCCHPCEFDRQLRRTSESPRRIHLKCYWSVMPGKPSWDNFVALLLPLLEDMLAWNQSREGIGDSCCEKGSIHHPSKRLLLFHFSFALQCIILDTFRKQLLLIIQLNGVII